MQARQQLATDQALLRSTKLHSPRPDPLWVYRPRVLALLDARPSGCLTLIVAPAGSGKTTVARQWAAAQPSRFAWLSLDANDSEPQRFFAYLVAAVRSILPDACTTTAGVLGAARARCSRRCSALYRIAQEALNNIENHADARRVRVALVYRHRGVLLSVCDDGQGFGQHAVRTGHVWADDHGRAGSRVRGAPAHSQPAWPRYRGTRWVVPAGRRKRRAWGCRERSPVRPGVAAGSVKILHEAGPLTGSRPVGRR